MARRYGATYNDSVRAVFSGDEDIFQQPSPQPMLFVFDLRQTVERIANQQGQFSVCLDPLADHADVLEELAGYGDGPHCEKLIIPKELKPEILRQLQLMNVTSKSLFPGLDGLGRSLTELTRLTVRFGAP